MKVMSIRSLILKGTLAAFVLTSAMSISGLAWSQDDPTETETYDEDELTNEGFVAVDDSMEHRDTGMPYVVTAYGLFFLLVMGYVVKLGRLNGQVTTELGDMRRELTDVADRLDELEG